MQKQEAIQELQNILKDINEMPKSKEKTALKKNINKKLQALARYKYPENIINLILEEALQLCNFANKIERRKL